MPPYHLFDRPAMPPVTLESAPDTPPKANTAYRGASSLLLVSFAAVYLLWGATFFAIRIGIESFPPLI